MPDPEAWAKVLRPHPARWRGWVVENTELFNDIAWENPDEQHSDVSTTGPTRETVDQSEPESAEDSR